MYTLSSGLLTVEVLDFGGTVRSVVVHGQKDTDVCLGFDSVENYLAAGLYCGATVGRCANRISGGRFTLNGKAYILEKNNGDNHHHGGFYGFYNRQFDGRIDGDSLVLSLRSPDGDQGYPGNLDFTATFTVTDGELKIVYTGKADADTLFNPTSHCYFNLAGEGSGDILNTVLQINTDKYLPINGGVVPSGEIFNVKDTPFDFTAAKPIGRDIDADDIQIKKGAGYDHNYCIQSGLYATAYAPESGIKMDCFATTPGVQFYSGNFIGDVRGKSQYHARYGFCLEPQFYPNAINTPGFVPPVLKAGETKSVALSYKFSTNA